jgi:hypothetical protein
MITTHILKIVFAHEKNTIKITDYLQFLVSELPPWRNRQFFEKTKKHTVPVLSADQYSKSTDSFSKKPATSTVQTV